MYVIDYAPLVPARKSAASQVPALFPDKNMHIFGRREGEREGEGLGAGRVRPGESRLGR